MLYSMTGYGKAVGKIANRGVSVEIKSVNSKHLDLNLRLSNVFRSKEMELRRLLGDLLLRGRVEVSVTEDYLPDNSGSLINREVFKRYYADLKILCQELRLAEEGLLATIMRIPDIFIIETSDLDETDWAELQAIVERAVADFVDFRCQEGATLATDLLARLHLIEQYAAQVAQIAPLRVQAIRQRLNDDLQQWLNPEAIDRNRFEQEVVYYLEKLDVTEELVRLCSHCRYFIAEIQNDTTDKGKKLNFIAQEIGREMNTIGSKANHADMQTYVVQMKDELEKIKEQLMNVM